jgi:cyanophycin synthetase
MAVLNAADPIVAAMAENTRGDVTYFAPTARHAADAEAPRAGPPHRLRRRRQLVAAQGKELNNASRWPRCRSPAAA